MSDAHVNLTTGSPNWKYSAPAIALHWLIALLIVFLLCLGWYMMEIEREPGADWYFNLHRSLGLVAGGLVLVRALWRATHRPVELPDTVPFWERNLALAAHWLLYACMIVMPLTGYLGASYNKSGVTFFGLLLPFWSGPSRELSKLFF